MRKIKIGVKEYPIKMTVNAIIAFEEEIGRPLSQVGDSVKESTSMIWHGLAAAAKIEGKELDLKMEQLGDVLTTGALNKAIKVAIEDLTDPN